MRKIIVEAYEDPSRPQGGHAVILLRGVDTMPERPSIRLRPIEIGDLGEVRGLWRGARVEPIATRSTPLGIEFVVGPDIVGHPHLLAGTPVVIEVPEADVRGEFLWPGVAPLAAPRRRHVVVPRSPRHIVAPPPANDDAHLVTAADHLPLVAESDGNLALRAEPANGSSAMPAPPPASIVVGETAMPVESASKVAEAPPQVAASVAAAHAEAARAAPLPDVAELRSALDAALVAASAPSASALPELPAAPDGRPVAEPRWTPQPRRTGLAGHGRLVAASAAALLLALGAWSLSSRRGPDVVATAPGASSPTSSAKSGNPAGAGGGAGAPQGGPGSAAAVGPAAIAGKPAACDAPVISTEPLPAGRMRLVAKASCKGGETVHISYGGADLVHRFDERGTLTADVDCFAGAAEPVVVRFADGSKQTVAVKAGDLDRVSKVAVIWKTPVDLDLHAFEYAALPGTKGDVWSGAPGSADAVVRAVAAEHKGRGFLSTAADAHAAGDHVEVYTFLHADGQTSGSVGLALDHATRGATPSDITCGTGKLAEVPYSLVVLAHGSAPRRESGVIAAAECGSRLGPEVRFNQSALPVLRIR